MHYCIQDKTKESVEGQVPSAGSSFLSVEHLVKANHKMKLELSANQSGTLNFRFIYIRVNRKENNYV